VADVARNPQGEWIGSMGLPDQGLDAAPTLLSMESRIMVEAKQSSDGKGVEGNFVCGSLRTVPVPLRLKRTSEPAVKPAGPGGPIGAEFRSRTKPCASACPARAQASS
jgi:hypothetical protein